MIGFFEFIIKQLKNIALKIKFINNYYRFKKTITNIVTIRQYIRFKLSLNKRIYWPIHKNSEVTHANNIYVGINSNPGTRPGCYIQGNGGIYIGNYVHCASNLGIISANHNPYDQTIHECKTVIIEDYCWLGQGALVMPGTHLGPRTIVGAGSVVTKSFPDGFCVIAGNPAKIIKHLDAKLFVPTKFDEEYYGFVPKEKFEKFANKYHIITDKKLYE